MIDPYYMPFYRRCGPWNRWSRGCGRGRYGWAYDVDGAADEGDAETTLTGASASAQSTATAIADLGDAEDQE